MQIKLHRLKNAVKDIKESWGEPNDSHTRAEYNGMCKGFDMLVTHFQELDDFTKWKKEKRNGTMKEKL